MNRLPFVATSLTILALSAPTMGEADHISARIRAGTIQVGTGSAISAGFAVSGSSGFAFMASTDSGTSQALCQPCVAGDTISLSTNMSPAYFGSARYRGKSYRFDFDNGGGWFAVEAPSFTLPDGEGTEPRTVEFQTTFRVAEAPSPTTFRHTFLTLQDETSTHELRLSGSGTATATFTVTFDPDSQKHLYFFESLRFEFSRK
jgi:hypothetical protein